MNGTSRTLAQDAEDLANGKKVPAAAPNRGSYRRVAHYWLRRVAKSLRDSDYREQMLRIALVYCPPIDPCPDCGFPKMEGVACDFCPQPVATPSESHADWYVEVSWDMDHGWLVSTPREDDGEMEEWDIPGEWLAGDRPTMKEAVAWARDVAKQRLLPLRIYHKNGKATVIPAGRIR